MTDGLSDNQQLVILIGIEQRVMALYYHVSSHHWSCRYFIAKKYTTNGTFLCIFVTCIFTRCCPSVHTSIVQHKKNTLSCTVGKKCTDSQSDLFILIE